MLTTPAEASTLAPTPWTPGNVRRIDATPTMTTTAIARRRTSASCVCMRRATLLFGTSMRYLAWPSPMTKASSAATSHVAAAMTAIRKVWSMNPRVVSSGRVAATAGHTATKTTRARKGCLALPASAPGQSLRRAAIRKDTDTITMTTSAAISAIPAAAATPHQLCQTNIHASSSRSCTLCSSADRCRTAQASSVGAGACRARPLARPATNLSGRVHVAGGSHVNRANLPVHPSDTARAALRQAQGPKCLRAQSSPVTELVEVPTRTLHRSGHTASGH